MARCTADRSSSDRRRLGARAAGVLLPLLLAVSMGAAASARGVQGKKPLPRLLFHKTQGPMGLELWDDAPTGPWRVREPRTCRVRAVNVGKQRLVLPDFSTGFGQLLGMPWQSVVGADYEHTDLVYDYKEEAYGLEPEPSKYLELGPGQALERTVAVTPAAPGTLFLTAQVRNRFTRRRVNIGIPTGRVAPDGAREMISGYKFVPVENAWTGSIECGGTPQVSPQAPAAVARQREAVRRLLDDASAGADARRKAFDAFVAPDDWLSWQLCLEVLERQEVRKEEWTALHGDALRRAVRLAQLGLAAPEWDDFLKRLDTSPAWETLRYHFVEIVGWAAGGPSPADSVRPRVFFLPSERQKKAAFAVLERWVGEGPGPIERKARRAIRTVDCKWKGPAGSSQ